MTELATVRSIGLKLHKSPNLRSGLIDELAQGDRVAILSRTTPTGSSIELAEVEVMRTRTSMGEGEVGWVRADLLELECPPLQPTLPDWPPIVAARKGAADADFHGKVVAGIVLAVIIALAAWLADLI